ncbi:MAG: amidohydrolase family protein [Candidatus Aminicenantes bacterium]|nr:amidohydrolase family protein [Candidatus Aminicenantes bacterium]
MNKRTRFVTAFVLFVLVALAAQAGETILIVNGNIVPVVGKPITKGCLLIKDGKIVKIAADIEAPSDATVIDAEGKIVFPGIVALMTGIGVTGYPGAGNDVDEVGATTPYADPYDAINPEDPTIEVTRLGGVTTVMTISGTMNVINGKSVVLNLEGDLAENMVIQRDAAQIFNLDAKGQSMFGPKRPGNYPSTHMGIVALIRDKLNQAKLQAAKLAAKEKKSEEKEAKEAMPSKRDLGMEALVEVVQGKIPVVFITSNEVSVRNALRLIEEYNLKGIISARAGVLKYADQLAAKKIPVIWAGTTTIPDRWEPYDLNYRTASILAKKGVLFCFDMLGFGVNSHNVRNEPVPASISVAHGLSEEEALKALTINPARMIGIDDMVGSLETGKVANLAIWSGSPVQLSSRVQKVIINGKVIPMTSLQTRLRDKFEKIVRERMARKK